MARRYGKRASKKVEKVMSERKRGALRSGSGRKVTSRKQAIAIGLSEARRAGAKVPKKKTGRKAAAKTAGRAKTAAKRKSATRKTAARKTAARKTGDGRRKSARRTGVSAKRRTGVRAKRASKKK